MKVVLESKGIGARVCFAWEGYDDKPFWYSTDISTIHKLGIKPDHDKLFMQKGTVIDFGDEGKGKIIDVQIEILDEYLVDGPSFRTHGKDFTFSLDVIFIVARV